MSAHEPSRQWREHYEELLSWTLENPEFGERVEERGGIKRNVDATVAWMVRSDLMSIFPGRYNHPATGDDETDELERTILYRRQEALNAVKAMTDAMYELEWLRARRAKEVRES